MADLINAVFYSFWTFAGTVILLSIAVRGVVAITAVIAAFAAQKDAR
ncbi:hypothetical protein [Shinella sp.]|nr:hypothetical protein [Shinella sp.]